ncbi:MAG: hypothetical protein MJ072_06725, partial [Clostridia bacterium]|nr:hypothetical protein [Clostridia bacterium]
MEFGLNLFSIRSKIQTKEDFLDTMKKLKAMGYDFVQYSGGPGNFDDIKEVSEEVGLPVVLTHSPGDRFRDEPEKLVADHKKI